jgi:hypothetical protein
MVAIRSFESGEEFKNKGTAETNQNMIEVVIKGRLNSGKTASVD